MGEIVPNKKPCYSLMRKALLPKKRPRSWAEYEKRFVDSIDMMWLDSDALVIVVHASLEDMRLVPGMTYMPTETDIYVNVVRYLVERIEHRGVTQPDLSLEALCHLDLLLNDVQMKLQILQRPSGKRKTMFSIMYKKIVELRQYLTDALARIGAEPPVEVQKDLSA